MLPNRVAYVMKLLRKDRKEWHFWPQKTELVSE